MKHALSIILLFLVHQVSAQEANSSVDILRDTIEWTAHPYIDAREDSSNYTGFTKFVTRGANDIHWIRFDKKTAKSEPGKKNQHSATKSKSLPPNKLMRVSNVEGSWTDIKTDGKMTYHVTLDGQSAKISIVRSGPVYTLCAEWIDSNTQKHQLFYNAVPIVKKKNRRS